VRGALLVGLLSFPAIAAAGASDSLTVAECADLARRAAPAVGVADAELRAARFDSLAAARNGGRAFALFGGATAAPRGFYDPALTDLGQYEVKIGVELSLLDGGRRARERMRAAGDALQAGLARERTGRESAVRAAALAVEILRLRAAERVQLQALDWLDRMKGFLESAVRAGTRGLSDKLRMDLERDAAEAALASTRVDAEAAARELVQVTGRGESGVAVRDPLPGEDRAPADEDSLRLCVLVDRFPELRAARAREARARLEVEEARRKNALQLDAAADAGLWGSDLTRWIPPDIEGRGGPPTLGDRVLRDAGASAGLSARLPLGDRAAGPSRQARSAQAEAAAQELSLEGDTQRRLGRDLIARWRATFERARAAEALADKAEANLIRVKSLYVGGAAALLELLDARQVLEEAYGRLRDARSEARLAQYEAESRR
jgi:outer membrane protein TolC